MRQSNNEIVGAARSTPDGSADQTMKPGMHPEERHRRIHELAYRRAEARGFAPGAELDDWLSAERDFDADHTSDLGLPPP